MPRIYMGAGAWGFIALIVLIVFVVMKLASKKQEVAVKLVLVIFTVIMVTGGYVFVVSDADFTSYDGVVGFGKLYLIWLDQAFFNLVGITGNVIDQQWALNSSTINDTYYK